VADYKSAIPACAEASAGRRRIENLRYGKQIPCRQNETSREQKTCWRDAGSTFVRVPSKQIISVR
jgi:hypothetical protein